MLCPRRLTYHNHLFHLPDCLRTVCLEITPRASKCGTASTCKTSYEFLHGFISTAPLPLASPVSSAAVPDESGQSPCNHCQQWGPCDELQAQLLGLVSHLAVPWGAIS